MIDGRYSRLGRWPVVVGMFLTLWGTSEKGLEFVVPILTSGQELQILSVNSEKRQRGRRETRTVCAFSVDGRSSNWALACGLTLPGLSLSTFNVNPVVLVHFQDKSYPVTDGRAVKKPLCCLSRLSSCSKHQEI